MGKLLIGCHQRQKWQGHPHRPQTPPSRPRREAAGRCFVFFAMPRGLPQNQPSRYRGGSGWGYYNFIAYFAPIKVNFSPTVDKSTKHFLSRVEVSSFKGIRNTTFSDLGQINLILGDNNVGKSSVLEALTISENPYKFLSSLRGLYFNKLNLSQIVNNVDFVTPFMDCTRPDEKIKISAQSQGSAKSKVFLLYSKEVGSLSKIQQEKLNANSTSVSFHAAVIKIGAEEHIILQSSPGLHTEDILYMPFIASNNLYADDLLGFYSKAIIPSKSKKQGLIQSMELFIPGLEDIEISTQANINIPTLVTRIKGVDAVIPLNMYGEGSIKFFRILVEIAVSADSRLMIDEIDSGIHYSRLKSLWRTTINSARQNNTQLFITTHNDECLAFLKEVLEEDEFSEMQSMCKCYTLKQLPNGSTKAYTYSFDEFSFAINQQIELRGGKNETY